MNIDLYYGFFIFLSAISIGSFLNVVALRGLKEENIAFPPSSCPSCKKQLKWYMNIPVLSYLFLKGKCGFCKCPISIQYPIVELLNALGYILIYATFGLTFKTLFLCILVSLFILICITDFKELVIIDTHTYIMIGLGLLYNILRLGTITPLESVLGVMAGFLIFEIMAKIGFIFTKSRAFGEGDTLIAMGLGAFFGWKLLLLIILFSVFIQAVYAIPVMTYNYAKEKNYTCAISLVLTVISVLVLKFIDPYAAYYLWVFSIILIVLAMCLINILKNIKNKTEDNLIMMPFGPALVIAGFMAIFFGDKINILNYLLT